MVLMAQSINVTHCPDICQIKGLRSIITGIIYKEQKEIWQQLLFSVVVVFPTGSQLSVTETHPDDGPACSLECWGLWERLTVKEVSLVIREGFLPG